MVGKSRFKFIPCWSRSWKSPSFLFRKTGLKGCFTKVAAGRSHVKCLLRDNAQVQRHEWCGNAAALPERLTGCGRNGDALESSLGVLVGETTC